MHLCATIAKISDLNTFQFLLFQQANSALHETVGDTIMYGVMTPQHLHRLRLINDSMLYTMGNETCDDNVAVDRDGYVSEDFGINTDITVGSSLIINIVCLAQKRSVVTITKTRLTILSKDIHSIQFY